MLTKDELEALQETDGILLRDFEGGEVPVGISADYKNCQDVFDCLVEEKGVEKTAKILGFFNGIDMVRYMADSLGGSYDIEKMIMECCDGVYADEIDYEAEAADEELDRRLGK